MVSSATLRWPLRVLFHLSTVTIAAATSDFYDLIVERHRRASTVITSNRDPSEWLALLGDQLLAQSAIDRFSSAAFELVIDGESYRDRQKPRLTPPDD